jgi:hypothetical protein
MGALIWPRLMARLNAAAMRAGPRLSAVEDARLLPTTRLF